jgi:ATP-dependent protease ClpP protease subunit
MPDFMLYGPIYPHEVRDYGIRSGVTDIELHRFLQEAGGERVRIRYNSRGGDADAGFAMKSLVESYDGYVEHLVDGMAASAATLPLMAKGMAGGSTKMASNASLMLHKSLVMLLGYFNADDLREVAEVNDTFDTRIAAVYAEKSGTEQGEWLERIVKDTYLTSGAAKDFKLIDDISGAVEVRLDQPEEQTEEQAAEVSTKRAAIGSGLEAFDNAIKGRFSHAPDWFQKRLSEFKDVKVPKEKAQQALNQQMRDLLEKTQRIGVGVKN